MQFLYPGASLGVPAFRSTFMVSSICLAIIGVCYTLTAETLTLKKTKPPKVIS